MSSLFVDDHGFVSCAGAGRLSEENESASNASDIVGNHSSDRMSSGGSSGSARNIEESDVSSTLTSVGGFQSTLGNEITIVAAKVASKAPEAGARGGKGVQKSPAALPAAGPDCSAGTTADMSSTATDTVTIDHIENQSLDTPGAYPQQAALNWQRSGNESIPDLSAVATGDAGGSGVPSDCFASSECPSHGMVSLCGRRREMEDAVVSKDSFVKLPCNEVGGCDAAGLEATPLHYFGVYDGHGGSQVSQYVSS